MVKIGHDPKYDGQLSPCRPRGVSELKEYGETEAFDAVDRKPTVGAGPP